MMAALASTEASNNTKQAIDELLGLLGFTPVQTHFLFVGETGVSLAANHPAMSDDLIKELISEYGFPDGVTQ